MGFALDGRVTLDTHWASRNWTVRLLWNPQGVQILDAKSGGLLPSVDITLNMEASISKETT